MNSNMGVGGVLLRIGLGMFITRLVLGTFLQNTAALLVALFCGLVIGGVWLYQQIKEAQASEALRRKDRSYGKSIWDD